MYNKTVVSEYISYKNLLIHIILTVKINKKAVLRFSITIFFKR